MDEPTYVASDVNEDDNPPVVFKLMPLEYTDGLSLLAEGSIDRCTELEELFKEILLKEVLDAVLDEVLETIDELDASALADLSPKLVHTAVSPL